MESPHVLQDRVESGGADELVADLDDAGPKLVLQILSILRAFLLYDTAVIEMISAFHQ